MFIKGDISEGCLAGGKVVYIALKEGDLICVHSVAMATNVTSPTPTCLSLISPLTISPITNDRIHTTHLNPYKIIIPYKKIIRRLQHIRNTLGPF